MLALSGWLGALYGLPRAFVLGMGIANVAYGACSGLLWRRPRRPLPLLTLLVAANGAWAALCLTAAAMLWTRASLLGRATLLLEGAFVGGLAVLEWRMRERLALAPVRAAAPPPA